MSFAEERSPADATETSRIETDTKSNIMESHATKKRRILNALLMGARLTPQMANEIGMTTEGTRIIRKLRENYPISKEKVAGSIYYRYWIDEAYLRNLKHK